MREWKMTFYLLMLVTVCQLMGRGCSSLSKTLSNSTCAHACTYACTRRVYTCCTQISQQLASTCAC